MLPLERRSVLIGHMAKKGSVTIPELSGILNVSEMTVRRDLKQLECEGFVRRTHGGAVYMSANKPLEPAFEDKRNARQWVKELLAGYAALHFVNDNGMIVMEGGTTVTAMAAHLSEFNNLTVATNGLNTLQALMGVVSAGTVLGCGGMVRERSNTFVGPIAAQFFAQIHAQYAFFSASGFTAEQGFTDPNPMEREIKLAMAATARTKVMLLDSAKFGHISLLTTFGIEDIDVLVTDADAPEEALRVLRDGGIDVHVVNGIASGI
ncbi:DeoR/GlpR family DNA-binding transcription regulator [Cohnella cellulosilytica]|uniref:DeoR/GlpR family DNA-binding transcription regulator n=1 Tax=Cohnella cellulosilytica TaxID=986710 RepID=A0ABW2FH35_9BACL